MAVFGAPVAYGDDPERAVRAALAVRQVLADLNAADPDLDLQARIAVNTGEAVVLVGARPGHGEAMVAGDVVNTAARLQVSAPVNGIVVGEETYRSTRGAVEYEPGEPVTARGKERPVPVWFARAARTPVGERMLSPVPMVGRERELDLLRSTWERVVGERRAHLVTIFGPPGIGKSRLALEFGDLVTELGGWTLRGRSTPYGASSPYAAFAAHLKQVARIFDSDPAAVAADKLRAAVADLIGAEEAPEVASHLASLAAMRTATEAPDRQTLFLAARRLVEQLAARRPTLLVFEDLHWADGSMLDLLDELAARLHGSAVFLLAVARPDLLTERPAWGGGLPAYTALPLEPLRAEDAQELAERLLGHRDLEAIARLLEISEGNPLFIEELSASLAERAGEAAEELPTSIRAIIASRLDALPAPERSLLLDAAVVGRVFWDGALPPVDKDLDVGTLLGSLERRDLIRRESVSRLQGQEQFRFKHALIREIAYQRLTRASRRTRHEAVARFLEEATGETAAASEAIARHWREAGDAGRAVTYFLAAAEDAGRGWAKERAVALYREGLELVPDEDPRRRELQLRLAVAVQALYHLPDAERLRRS
jgi:predicted ATPase